MFFLSVCCPGAMTLVYCNVLVPFKCLKTKLTIFILLFCVFLLTSLIFLFITWLFSIWCFYNCEVKVSTYLQQMEELGNLVTVYVQLNVSLQFLEQRNPVALFQSLVLLLKFAFMYNFFVFSVHLFVTSGDFLCFYHLSMFVLKCSCFPVYPTIRKVPM